MKIEDNFLDQEDFDKIQNIMMGSHFPWFYNDGIDTEDDVDKFQFIYGFYQDHSPGGESIKIVSSILEVLQPISLFRIKSNLLTRTPTIVENEFHVDIHYGITKEKLKQWTTSIFYINTNNGYTKFEDGTKVESVANRMITFSSNKRHTGTSCTDEKKRVVINFNYFKKS